MFRLKSILKGIGLLVLVLLLGVIGFAATKPDHFRIERSIEIQTSAEKVYSVLTDLRQGSTWSPFEKDPGMQRKFSGSETGKGAIYEWEGKEAGVGRMEITETVPFSKIVLKLDFLKPFEAHDIVEYTIASDGKTARLTWAMHGANNYFSKVMSVFCDIDKMVGSEFETGLANLKRILEK